ncbi:msp1 [Arthroderma uncinatum]|uniref:msp1 n=1 Tax=Arthroderma uncinatum TaxID=74035 RepID=UPI00144A9F18|nr:msp1 [Arthroderma uncinatum]KAF3483192.1 msp1 [Arthroderma uncinatum]
MSGRLLSRSAALFSRRAVLARQFQYFGATRAGGLFSPQGSAHLRVRSWPLGTNAIHNVPAIRTISFARVLPKLALKLARIPAMFGGAMIAGLAYIQYQAAQAGNYAIDVIKSAGETAGGVAMNTLQGLRDIAEQAQEGFQNTKNNIELPEWIQKILRLNEQASSDQGGSSSGGSGGSGGSPKKSNAGAAMAGAVAGSSLGFDSDQDNRSAASLALDEQMMTLTRKMIEIRNMLQRVGQSNTLTLPSIVVIGSQSSGKSSVLEAIVGHEFLPKGFNMVTRRPIELTLVNTPDSSAEYGEFPALGLGKITDFSQVQRTLTDLNLAVPEKDCVMDEPIQLSIYSPHVPDLSLIDLPGYIQVAGRGQPQELKQKISDLCDKYIQAPNIILAISAADVDLANSTALRASRRVDPRGERTIGVITKMDLVDPERGASILSDRKYPLRLGYVGIISRIPQTAGLFSRGNGNISTAIVRNENAYFNAHPQTFGPDSELAVGTSVLRKKLMQTLEQTMASNLAGTRDAVSQELEEATYEFKVQYNDRPLSAESYLAESLDSFKRSFKEFSESFGRPHVRELLKAHLDQRVMDILAQRYWNKPVDDISPALPDPDPLSSLPTSSPDSVYWRRKLDASSSALTKLGIGRLATTIVANSLQNHIDSLVASSTFNTHPYARKIIEASTTILNDRFFSTSDQVENCIKPYKFEIEVDDMEWSKGRESVTKGLKEELKACENSLKNVENTVGKRKLRDVMAFVDKSRKGDANVEGDGSGGAGGFSASLIEQARGATFLRDRAEILKMRLLAVRSKQCASKKNRYYCPEVFLDVVADKLTATAVLFLNVELLSEFYYHFPRELDLRLGRHLSEAEVERFAREDPRIRRHLDVIQKKEMLELVLQKIESLQQLEGRSKSNSQQAGAAKERVKGSWRLF